MAGCRRAYLVSTHYAQSAPGGINPQLRSIASVVVIGKRNGQDVVQSTLALTPENTGELGRILRLR